MKILYHHRIRSVDGQYVHIEELVRQLRALGHEIRIVGPGAVGSSNFGSESRFLRVLKATTPRALYEALEFSYSAFDFCKLVIAARRFQPDIIYERYNLFTPTGVWVKSLLGIPLICEVNAPLAEERASYGGISLSRLAKWSQRYVWSKADRVISVTSVLRDIIISQGASPDSVMVMSNGVNPEDFGFDGGLRNVTRRNLCIEDKFVIGFTGFVREWHGLDKILALMCEPMFSDAVLLIVGDGPAIPGLRETAGAYGLSDRLVITGVLPRTGVAGYVSAFDVAIQPHVVSYASPLKLQEYLAMGLPVVAPDSPNIREVLVDGDNALLFDPKEKGSLQTALERLKADSSLRRKLAHNAILTIEKLGLTWRNNAERVVAIGAGLTEGSHVNGSAAGG